jgi:hypothetical protein
VIRLALAVTALVAFLVAPALLREATPRCGVAVGELVCLPGTVVNLGERA